LADTTSTAAGYLATEFGEYELILVNDGSTDASLRIAEQYENDSIRILSYEPNRGKGYAVRAGMLLARGEVVFFCDADLPYGLEVLRTGYDKLMSGRSDVVVGSRRIWDHGYDSYPLMRKIASNIFVFIVNAVLGLGVSDSQCGFKGFTRVAAEQVFRRTQVDGFAFDMEALCIARNMGFRIDEMPVELLTHSKSKVRVLRDSGLMLRDLVKVWLRSNRYGGQGGV